MKKIPLSLAFEKILNTPNVASQKPIYETYDKNVQGNTVHERGKVAASITTCFRDFPELDEKSSQIAVVIGIGGNTNLAKISAKDAAENAIAQAVLNIACTGGIPLAATDCLNFGNPEKPDQMGDLVLGIEGVKNACETLHIPIVSGNVSLYNECAKKSIPPSAIISVFGRIDNPRTVPQIGFQKTEETIFVIGSRSQNLGGSEFLRLFKQEDSHVPETNYKKLKKLCSGLRISANENIVSVANPILRGGLFAALCQSTFEKNIGVQIDIPADQAVPQFLFAEDLGAIISTSNPDKIKEIFGEEAIEIGKTTKDFDLLITHKNKVIFENNLAEYKTLWENCLREIF
ncbi:hypothetical protein KAI58_02905 [Candidatus Gracilibacteria bacterium]|nr:hypothetical protein [Candidatus Gracilibacteria bacterium]